MDSSNFICKQHKRIYYVYQHNGFTNAWKGTQLCFRESQYRFLIENPIWNDIKHKLYKIIAIYNGILVSHEGNFSCDFYNLSRITETIQD